MCGSSPAARSCTASTRAWIYDNILEQKPKAAPWVKEDVPAIMAQLAWLKALHDTEPDLTILVTHDDARFEALAKSRNNRRRTGAMNQQQYDPGGTR